MVKQLVYCVFMVQLLFAVGCESTAKQVVTQTNDLPTQTIKSFATTITSPVPSTTPTLTQIPLPTFTSDESKTKLFNLLHDNGGCTLPCFLGYSPGTSTKEDIQDLFSQFTSRDTPDLAISKPEASGRSTVHFYIRLNENYLNIGVSAYEDKGQVEALGMGTFSQPGWDLLYEEVLHYYMLPQILTTYGKPSQILVLTYRNDRQRPDVTTFPIYLVLLYPSQGFFVEYEMDRETKGDNFIGCPSRSFVSIAAWDPQNDKAFERIVAGFGLGLYPGDYKAIHNATSMTLDDFDEVFSNPNNGACIETLIETWPNP